MSTTKSIINSTRSDDANLMPISADGTGFVNSSGLNRYRWADLKHHSKHFLLALLFVNVFLNTVLLIVIAVTVFLITQLASISPQGLGLTAALAVVTFFLTFAVYKGLKSCIRLAHYMRVGFKV